MLVPLVGLGVLAAQRIDDERESAATALSLEFRLSEKEIDESAAALDGEGRFTRRHVVEAVDRDHVYVTVPETLLGAEYIQTANDDKDNPKTPP